MGFLVIFGLNSVVNAQNCSSGACSTQGRNMGGMTPVTPRPAPQGTNTTQNNQQSYPAPVYVNGKDGSNGVNGTNGKDGKDADPTVLASIQKSLDAINSRLQNSEEAYSKIDSQLSSLQSQINTYNATQTQLGGKVDQLGSQVASLNAKMTGQLRVRFKYDPKTNSLSQATPVSVNSN